MSFNSKTTLQDSIPCALMPQNRPRRKASPYIETAYSRTPGNKCHNF
jgi:hypothetical protein